MTKQYDNYADLITFTRASGGTALRRVGYGSELVTNGTFDTDSDWGTSGTVTFSGGQVTLASAFAYINQAITVSSGSVVRVSYEVVSNTSPNGNLALSSASFTNTTIFIQDTVGLHTLDVVVNDATKPLRLIIAKASTVVLDNVSVKEVIFDRATDPLVLFNHPTNAPRIEYDADGNRLGLLIEEARTNLVTYSEDFDNAAWGKDRLTVTANATSSPSGSVSAVAIIENSDNSFHSLSRSASFISGTAYTLTVYAKKPETGSQRFLQLTLGSVPFTGLPTANFDLITGQLVLTGAGNSASASIEFAGNGWYRCRLTATADVTAGSAAFLLLQASSSASRFASYQGDGTSGVYIWGAQLEAGSFPTSYIPTAGATATRAADVASIPTSAFGYNPDKGTVVVEFDTQFGTPTTFPRIWEISGGSGGVDRVYGFINAANSQIRCGVLANGVTAADFSAKTDPTPASGKLAFAFAENDFSGVIDGSSPVTDTSGSLTTPSIPRNKLTFGGAASTGASNISGHIKSIQYFPRRLTDSQLQRLTS